MATTKGVRLPLLRGIIYTSGTQVCIQAIGVVTGILIARLLGPTGRGQLAAIISWPSMLAYLGNLGLPVALAYASARYPGQRHQLFGNGLLAALVQWTLLASIGWFVIPRALAGHQHALAHIAFLYLCAYLPLNLVTLYANAIQQGAGAYGSFNAVRISVPAGYATLLLFLWAIGRMSVAGVVLANVLSNVLTLALALSLALPLLVRLSRASGVRWFDFKGLRRDLRYAVSAQIGTLQPFTGMRIDVLALTLVVTSHELGLYMVALAASQVIRAQGFALGQVVLPEVAKRGHTADQWRLVHRFLIFATAGGTLAGGVAVIWATPLLRLVYGQPFTAAAPMMRILCCAGALGVVYRVLADGLRGMGHPLVSTLAETAGVAVGVVVLFICAPAWGARGAAVGVASATTVSFLVAAYMALRVRTRSSSLMAQTSTSNGDRA